MKFLALILVILVVSFGLNEVDCVPGYRGARGSGGGSALTNYKCSCCFGERYFGCCVPTCDDY